MTDFTPEFIADELAKAEKATPRPYYYGPEGDYIAIASHVYNVWSDLLCEGNRMENAEYLITAVNHYEDALKEIGRLRAYIDRLLQDDEHTLQCTRCGEKYIALAGMEAVLQWYADCQNWINGICGSIKYKFDFGAETSYWKPDNGDLARKILNLGGEE